MPDRPDNGIRETDVYPISNKKKLFNLRHAPPHEKDPASTIEASVPPLRAGNFVYP